MNGDSRESVPVYAYTIPVASERNTGGATGFIAGDSHDDENEGRFP
jgi:hypothetical protein